MKLIFKNKYQTFLTILFLFLISCSDQVENNLTANEIITNSSSRVSEWNSFRFSLEHEEGLTSLIKWFLSTQICKGRNNTTKKS